ncbi:hypothetical protein NBRC116493_10630 [Aurantivibrio infirmus]
MDYSELSATGEHVFLVTRTHGTSGAVSVQYSSHGDPHDSVSGTLSWANGDQSVQSIRVNVPSKSPGDHRIYMQLSNATGGAALHFSNHTRAYGVIDDGTVAADSEAVFFDASLGSNGAGTQSSPFNNIYDALASVGSKRYIYGRGTVVPDGTNSNAPYAISGVRSINVPASRSDENSRVYIRNWPGSSLTINGNGSRRTAGFYSNGNDSYHTYRGINFINLDASGTGAGAPGFGIWYHYGTASGINVELCNFNGINGSENNGGVNYYGTTGGRVWRCTFANIAKDGDTKNGNTGGVYSYSGNYISIQRSEFASTMSKGTFHKRTDSGKISFNCRFNIYRDCVCYYGQSGGGNPGHFGIVVSNNAFIGPFATFKHLAISPVLNLGQNQVSNNYFYQSGNNVEGAVANWGGADLLIFNNVFDNCKYVYSDEQSSLADLPALLDYNVVYNTTDSFASNNFASYSAASFASTFNINFSQNQRTGDPRPANPGAEDFSLQNGSSAIAAGIGGADAGIYLTDLETIGANAITIINPNPFPAPGPNPSQCTPPQINSGQKIIFS